MNPSARLGLGFRAALGLLTIIPAGHLGELVHLRDRDPQTARRVYGAAMILAPLAFAPCALVAAAVGAGVLWLGVSPWVAATLVVIALAVLTRAMHLDALADTVDGLGAGWDRARALEVMRTGDVGPMGAAALVLVLLAQVGAAAALLAHPRGVVVVGVAALGSRVALAWLSRLGLPAARPEGLGEMVAESVRPWQAALGWVLAAGPLAGACAWAGWGWQRGVVAVLVAWALIALLERTIRRVIGGVTGDVLGAGVELSFAALLIVLGAGLS